MSEERVYAVDDYASIARAMRRIEAQRGGAYYCDVCQDGGWTRTRLGVWRQCGLCGNPSNLEVPRDM